MIYPREYGGTKPDDYDAFYELILADELARCGGGVLGQMAINSMAIPPILLTGSEEMKQKVCVSEATTFLQPRNTHTKYLLPDSFFFVFLGSYNSPLDLFEAFLLLLLIVSLLLHVSPRKSLLPTLSHLHRWYGL